MVVHGATAARADWLVDALEKNSCEVVRFAVPGEPDTAIIQAGIELARAQAVAQGKDVRVGGGVTTARQFLKAGLVDQLHVGITPILLGQGIRLWDDLRGLEADYSVTSEAAESGVLHLTYRR